MSDKKRIPDVPLYVTIVCVDSRKELRGLRRMIGGGKFQPYKNV
jgi:hypothetical protein